MENFNLIDEKWIPSNVGMISIRDCFENENVNWIGSNPTETISLIKFLFAIGQSANKFETQEDILNITSDIFKKNILTYLDNQYVDFYLYSDKNPFLQCLALKMFDSTKFYIDNCSIRTLDETLDSAGHMYEHQFVESYSDEWKALKLLITLGNSLSIKSAGESFEQDPEKNANAKHQTILTKNNYKKYLNSDKTKINGQECYGLFNGCDGILHGFLFAENILNTVLINMFSNDVLNECNKKLGIAPWEKFDWIEDNEEYKNSYMFELIPLNKFLLLNENNDTLLRTEGLRSEKNLIFNQFSVFKYTYEMKEERITTICKPNTLNQPIFSLEPLIKANYNFNISINNSLNICCGKDIKENLHIWLGGTYYGSNTGMNYCKVFNNCNLDILNFDFIFDKKWNSFIKSISLIKNNILFISKNIKKFSSNSINFKNEAYIELDKIKNRLFNNEDNFELIKQFNYKLIKMFSKYTYSNDKKYYRLLYIKYNFKVNDKNEIFC